MQRSPNNPTSPEESFKKESFARANPTSHPKSNGLGWFLWASLMVCSSASAHDPFSIDYAALDRLRVDVQKKRASAQAAHIDPNPLGHAPTPTGFQVPFYKVQTFVSAPHEDLSEWLWSISPHLQDHTKRMHLEVCGRIFHKTETSQYALLLTTSRSALFCAFSDVSEHLPGFWPTHETIHTHPPGSMELVSDLDKKVSQIKEDAVFVEPEDFSPEDLEAGDGWLVTPLSKLLHVSNGTVHEHKRGQWGCPVWTGKLSFRSRFMLDTIQKEDTTE